MKKLSVGLKPTMALAALAALFASGAASAQANVTIYGLVDLSIAKSNAKANSAPNPGAPGNNAYTVQQSTTSRIGFRGTEDLGQGLSAQFQIEHRFNPDTGAPNSGASFWNGRSWVQLSKAGVGSVYLGRDHSPVFWIQLKSDPFGNNGLGSPLFSMTYADYATPDPVGNAVRTSNAINFKTAKFGGFTAQFNLGLSENTQLGRNLGVNVEYANGPVYAAVGHESLKGGVSDGLGMTNAALHYDFGVVKLMGYLAQSTTRRANTVAGENTNRMWMVSASAPLVTGTVKAMYARVNPEGANNTRTKLGLGYDYPLSKRTNLYADVGLARADGRANNNAVAFGVRHFF